MSAEEKKPTERVGVYVCHCGTNIAGVVNVGEVSKWASDNLSDQGVVIARDYKFMCSSLGQELIQKDIKEQKLTRVVVAACSPHLHEKTFRNACKGADLNPYLCELVSIREQDSWVHTDKIAATEKAKAIIAGGVARVIHHEPLEPLHVPIHPATLIVAWDRVATNRGATTAGSDGWTVTRIEAEVGVAAFLDDLRAQITSGQFRPQPVRERKIPKPGGSGKVRRLGIATVTDRVVQAALKLVLEPIFEADFEPVSYGFRPKRRAQDAIAEVHYFGSKGYTWVFEADITNCLEASSHCSFPWLS